MNPLQTLIMAAVGALALTIATDTRATKSQSPAALALTKVTGTVYSAIGEAGPPTYENGGHNNNLSVVLTEAGVVVFNGGDSYQLAHRLHLAIKALTDLPVLWVVNENGQGHSFLVTATGVSRG